SRRPRPTRACEDGSSCSAPLSSPSATPSTPGSPTSACASSPRRSAPATRCSSTTSDPAKDAGRGHPGGRRTTAGRPAGAGGNHRRPRLASLAAPQRPKLWPQERLFFELYAYALRDRPGTEGFLDGIVESWVAPVPAARVQAGADERAARADA